jgi:sialidase-1
MVEFDSSRDGAAMFHALASSCFDGYCRRLMVFGCGWILTVVGGICVAIAADPFLERTEVFPAGMKNVALYRIPGVVTTPSGTLLAYCEARRNTKADWGEIEVHLRRSTDQGKTWSDSVQIAHHGERIEGNPRKPKDGEREQTVNNPVAIVDRVTGNIEFLYCINYARCFSMRSRDDGQNWSSPREITPTFEAFRKQYPWQVIATGPGHGIQLKSGRLVVPIWLAYGKVGDHAPSACGTIYSDDHGETWVAGEIAVPNTPPYGNPNESVVAELSDGRVMLMARSVSAANRKIVTLSPNGAHGWSTPIFQKELWEPICMAGLVSLPTRPGYMVFSNPHRLAFDSNGKEVPAGRGKRENLSIKLSTDHGQSWPTNKTLEAGLSAYSDLAVLGDGSIVCLYEGDKTIMAARFNLDWIQAKD